MQHILFDNDGVNINSEDLAMRIMDDWGVALVRRYKPNADLPPDYIYRTYPGTSTDKIVEALIIKFELPSDRIRTDYKLASNANVPVDLADLVTIETIGGFKRKLEAVPGTAPALLKIREMFGQENMALATTSRADRMDISLAYAVDPQTRLNAGLNDIFPEGPRRRSGYGHPNKYDEAFAALGWEPAETIVVEDSISGVSKAMAGRPGVSVIGTVASRFYDDKDAQAVALLEKGAKIVISDMADLPRAAAWLKEGMSPNNEPEWKSPVYIRPVAAAPRSALSHPPAP